LDDFQGTPEDHGLSLDELSAAYAQLVDRGNEPYEESASESVEIPSTPAAAAIETAANWPDEAGITNSCEVSPRSILEAILFVGHPNNEPLTAKKVSSLMRGVRPQEIDELVRELNACYAAEGCPYSIISVGSGYCLQLQPGFDSLRNKFFGRVRDTRLSQIAVDVLAIVAYNQPLTRDDVDRIRGKASGSVLNQLVRRGLLRLERLGKKPRVAKYYTTERFLHLFGLESIDELPRSQDLERNL
jgi:segregation and condensation protein B